MIIGNRWDESQGIKEINSFKKTLSICWILEKACVKGKVPLMILYLLLSSFQCGQHAFMYSIVTQDYKDLKG